MESKYQEALDFVVTNLILTCKDNHDFYQMINDAKTTLQELVDKETSNKPILKTDVDLGIDYDDVYVCSKCGQIVSDLVKPEYCSKCGQHLDWKASEVK